MFALQKVHLHKGIHKTVIIIMLFDNNCTHTMVNENFGIFVEVGSSGCLSTTPVIRAIVNQKHYILLR